MLVQHRVWSFLPAGIESTLDEMPAAIPNRKVKGKCLTVIISAAALVEGIVTDAIESELDAMQQDPEKRVYAEKQLKVLNRKGWAEKKKIVNAWNWNLAVLDCFEMVELLFSIRNNLGHGRSYRMKDERVFKDKAFARKESVKIDNELYHKVYARLLDCGLISPLDDIAGMSIEVFLAPAVAKCFYQEAVAFLRSFLEMVPLRYENNLRREFEEAMK